MLKVGDLYKDKYEVLFANEFFFIIDNMAPHPICEFNIITQDTLKVKWRYETLEEAGEAYDILTEAMEKELEEILLLKRTNNDNFRWEDYCVVRVQPDSYWYVMWNYDGDYYPFLDSKSSWNNGAVLWAEKNKELIKNELAEKILLKN